MVDGGGGGKERDWSSYIIKSRETCSEEGIGLRSIICACTDKALQELFVNQDLGNKTHTLFLNIRRVP